MDNENFDMCQSGEESLQNEIIRLGSATAHSSRGCIHCLTIIGQIEGHILLPPNNKSTKYEHVMPMLAAIEESDEIDALLVLLNTMGGDIEAGLGIAELIAGMKKPTASLVLGGGHSIGVPQSFTYFERIQERIVTFVADNSKIDRAEFVKMMLRTGELTTDVGSVIYGEEAVSCGLIDALGGLSDALGYLHGEIAAVRDKK